MTNVRQASRLRNGSSALALMGVGAFGEIREGQTRAKTLLGPARAALRVHIGGGRPATIDARALIQAALGRIGCEREAVKEVEVRIYCVCDTVHVEPRSFADALYCLLDNAIRASNEGDSVLVSVREVGDGDVLWQIVDSGEGMCARGLADLGELPRPTAERGTGLGVALAHAIVERHGGLLRFESAPGVGTTASVWLPEAAVVNGSPTSAA